MPPSHTVKLLLAFALLLFALAAGVYLSGLIIVLVLGVDVPVEMNTWWKYWRIVDTPRVAPFASKIKIGSAVGFGLPLLGWLALLVPLLRTRQPSTHGNARFAHKSELAMGGMLKEAGNGIVVGKAGNDLIRLGGTRHALLSAPTRSGKGVGAVIPNLLMFEESLMVLDIKQEAFDLTSGWRARYGPVYLFNPFAEDLRTHRWNPLTYVSRDPKFRITDLQAIAAILYEEDPQRDSFWTNQARNCFLAASLYLCETDADRAAQGFPADQRPAPSLGRIYRLFSGDGGDLKAYLKELASRPYLSKDCKTAFSNLTSLADQTFTSVIGSFQEPLHIFLNPILDAATSGDDFDLRHLRRQKMTVYVGITPNKLAEARKLLNPFFSQAININTQQLPEKDPSLKYQCLLLLDEFTSIGRVDIIAHAISYLAGYNMRVFCVIQSLSQLDATYGPEVARTMVTNMACQVVYTPREQRDANEYSEMLGYTTLRRRTRTTSHGQSGSVSYAEVEERRALMLPQELKALSPEEEIIFVEGIAHPIKCSKIRYYKDGFFKERLKEKPPVPMLALHDDEAQPATAVATAAPVDTADTLQFSPSTNATATLAAAPQTPYDDQEQDVITDEQRFNWPKRRRTTEEILVSGKLQPPPLPPRLLEMLQGHPEIIERLQSSLIHYIKEPSPAFLVDCAIWDLQSTLSRDVDTAWQQALDARKLGDADATAQAEAEYVWMVAARSRDGGLRDVQALSGSLETHRAGLLESVRFIREQMERRTRMTSLSTPYPWVPTTDELLANGELPLPPLPRRLLELLGDYPDLIKHLQSDFCDYIRLPSYWMHDAGSWSLNFSLDSFIRNAKHVLAAAEIGGNAESIAHAKSELESLLTARSEYKRIYIPDEIYEYQQTYKDKLR